MAAAVEYAVANRRFGITVEGKVQLSMLVIQRKPGESVMIGQDIRVTVVEMAQGRVRLSIQAPVQIKVRRSEHTDAAEETRRRKSSGRRKSKKHN